MRPYGPPARQYSLGGIGQYSRVGFGALRKAVTGASMKYFGGRKQHPSDIVGYSEYIEFTKFRDEQIYNEIQKGGGGKKAKDIAKEFDFFEDWLAKGRPRATSDKDIPTLAQMENADFEDEIRLLKEKKSSTTTTSTKHSSSSVESSSSTSVTPPAEEQSTFQGGTPSRPHTRSQGETMLTPGTETGLSPQKLAQQQKFGNMAPRRLLPEEERRYKMFFRDAVEKSEFEDIPSAREWLDMGQPKSVDLIPNYRRDPDVEFSAAIKSEQDVRKFDPSFMSKEEGKMEEIPLESSSSHVKEAELLQAGPGKQYQSSYDIVEEEGPYSSSSSSSAAAQDEPKPTRSTAPPPPGGNLDPDVEFHIQKARKERLARPALQDIEAQQAMKYAAGAAGGAALLGLAAYGVHKAYKYLKRKRASANAITSEAGSGNTGGQGPAPGESATPHPPSALSSNLPAAQASAVDVPGGADLQAGEYGGGGGGGSAGGGTGGGSAGGSAGGAGGAGAGASHPPSAGAGQQVQVNAVDANGAPLFPQKESTGPDTDRTEPITPATGSKQTVDTANSIVGAPTLRKMAKDLVKAGGPEAVHGTARERANMGKGALDSYSFNGPYDYPVYPGGRPDSTLTLMGAWRTTRGGNGSSLWYSKKTAKGADAKRNKYFKWSTKGGGNWRKLTKDEMVNIFQKRTGSEGGNFYGVPAGARFADLINQQLAEKQKDIALGKRGAQIQQDRKMGFIGEQPKKKRKVAMPGGCHDYDMSAHN